MPATQKSLRIPEGIVKEIEEIARDKKRDFSSVTKELLEEAIKAHRCPGIVFTEGTSGKRARIAGTGIEVWEVISALKSVDNNFKRLTNAYDWLSVQQLKSAVGYYELYRDEIDKLVTGNDDWTVEKIKKKYPFLNVGKE
jgi:uncharacterized protein (DUF433 family)